MVVFLVAGPVTVGCVFIAVLLLAAGVIGPASYVAFRPLIYVGIGFLVLASFAAVAAAYNKEF